MQDLLHAFPGQDDHEPVYVFARPDPLSFIPTALVFLIIFLFGLGSQYLVSTGYFQDFIQGQTMISILVLGLFNLFVLIVFLVAVLDFYFNIVIVTDRRLVDIDQEVLFYRKISELSLIEIEDVSAVTSGLLANIFNYGQVEIQTAGKDEHFTMDDVRFPREITAIALDLAEQAKNIPDIQRIPSTPVLAVINNQALQTLAQLQTIGAILPDDFRSVNRNAP